MKKLYMLLTLIMLGVASMAAQSMINPYDGREVFLRPEAAAQLRAKMQTACNDKLADGSLQLLTRSWYDKGAAEHKGERYYFTMFLDQTQRWCDVLFYIKDGQQCTYTFEEFPFYIVWFQMNVISYENYDSTGAYENSGFIPQFAFWPCYYFYSQMIDAGGCYADVPEDEINYDPVLPMDLCNNPKYCRIFKELPMVGDGIGVAPVMNATETQWESWTIANQDFMRTVNSAATVYWTTDWLPGTTYFNGTSGPSIEFQSLKNNDELEMKYTAYVAVETKTGNILKKACRLSEYKGSTKVDAFEKKTIEYPISELHLYLDGVTGSDYVTAVKDPYMLPWGPVKRYYMAGVGTDHVKVVYKDERVKQFDQDNISFLFDYEDPLDLSYFFGALYSDVNSEKPYGNWTIANVSYYIDPVWGVTLKTVPEPGLAIPSYNEIPDDMLDYITENGKEMPDDKFTEDDGFTTVFQTLRLYFMQGGHIANGTTEGFQFVGEDQYGNDVVAKFNGDFFYHGDPKDVQKYDMLPTVGTGSGVNEAVAETVAISAAEGVITVSTESACRVNVYDMNGKTVYSAVAFPGAPAAIALPGGFYVVKAGNASRKVVL